MLEEAKLPDTLIEYIFCSGIYGWGAITLGVIALLATLVLLFSSRCMRGYLMTLALSLATLFVGGLGTIQSLINVFGNVAINPTANASDVYGGLYMAMAPLFFAIFLAGPGVVLNLIGIAVQYKPSATMEKEQE